MVNNSNQGLALIRHVTLTTHNIEYWRNAKWSRNVNKIERSFFGVCIEICCNRIASSCIFHTNPKTFNFIFHVISPACTLRAETSPTYIGAQEALFISGAQFDRTIW